MGNQAFISKTGMHGHRLLAVVYGLFCRVVMYAVVGNFCYVKALEQHNCVLIEKQQATFLN
jgi:hypothetical protein